MNIKITNLTKKDDDRDDQNAFDSDSDFLVTKTSRTGSGIKISVKKSPSQNDDDTEYEAAEEDEEVPDLFPRPEVVKPLTNSTSSGLSFLEPEEDFSSAKEEPLVDFAHGVKDENSSATEKVSFADAKIQEIDVSKISPNPFQPRKVFDPVGLQELADSIKEHGVIQPLVVTETSSGYEIVVGERRFRASQLAGLIKVPALVKKTMVDQTKLEVALIENIQRRELNPIEEAMAYDRLIKTFKLTQEQVAKKVGKSRPAVANTVRLLNLPAEIQRAVIEGKLTEGHARPLLSLLDQEKMLALYREILDKGWNVRQIENKVKELLQRKVADTAAPDPRLLAMENSLRSKLGTTVKIHKQGATGKITIEFYSDEELSEIISKMGESI